MDKKKKRVRVITAVFVVAALIAFNPISVLYWYPNDDDHAARVLRSAGAKVRRTPRLLWLSAHSDTEIMPYGDVWDVSLNNITIDSNVANNMAALRWLEILSIGNCRIEDDCASVGPPENKLRMFSIMNSNAEDRHISFLANNPSLQFLILVNTEISDDSIPTILSCQRLTYIALKKHRFSQDGIRRLRAGLPRANVEVDRPSPVDKL